MDLHLRAADHAWPVLRRMMGGHATVYRATHGLIGHHVPGVPPMLLLDHVGAKSGQKRTSPLAYLRDGDDVVIVASKGGYAKNPAWYHNLMAHPDTTVQVGSKRSAVHARTADPCRARAPVAEGGRDLQRLRRLPAADRTPDPARDPRAPRGLAPAPTRLRPVGGVLDRAEAVGNPVLTAMANEHRGRPRAHTRRRLPPARGRPPPPRSSGHRASPTAPRAPAGRRRPVACPRGGESRRRDPRSSAPAAARFAHLGPRVESSGMAEARIIVLEGDETGQELLEQAIRVLDPALTQVRPGSRALRPVAGEPPPDQQRGGSRRRRARCGRPASASRRPRSRRRARTTSAVPNRHPARGDRRQGDHPHRAAHPGRDPDRRRALPDRGGPHGRRRRLRREAVAQGGGRRRDRLPHRAHLPQRLPGRGRVRFRTARGFTGASYGGPKWTVSPIYEGLLKEELDAASERHSEVPYSPVLIDATYAGLVSGAGRRPAGHPGPQPRR